MKDNDNKIVVTYDWTGQNFQCSNIKKEFSCPAEFYAWHQKNLSVYIWHVSGLYN